MAPSSSSSTFSSSKPAKSSAPIHPHRRSHLFTPIQEENESEEGTEERQYSVSPTPSSVCTDKSMVHHLTPLHHIPSPKVPNGKKKRSSSGNNNGSAVTGDDLSVFCNYCRPTTHHHRDKNSIVPVDLHSSNNHKHHHPISMPSPNGILRSFLSGLSRKSPKPTSESSATSTPSVKEKEEQWKIAVAELSHKLVSTSRKRDEAILEASRLKYSMAELEKKLNKLEIYCHNLKSGLEVCSNNNNQNNSPSPISKFQNLSHFPVNNQDKIIENFLTSVSESRSSIRLLSRALTLSLRQTGVNLKVCEKISSLLHPYDIKLSFSKNPRNLLFYLEALLNIAFYEDFETVGFNKSSTNKILNPVDRCESNYDSYNLLHHLTWEEVLSKGTKHFSEEFSKFCDRKMSEVVSMLSWNRPWSENLLQAFFNASKSVWLVHLLANSVHPNLSIFRVEKGSNFDSVYMEDMGVGGGGGDKLGVGTGGGGDKLGGGTGGGLNKRLVPSLVRIMITPGFYVYDNVVKCKVICRYYSLGGGGSGGGSSNLDYDINIVGSRISSVSSVVDYDCSSNCTIITKGGLEHSSS